MIVLEPDATDADCYDPGRGQLLTHAVQALSNARHSVYLDAGYARWQSAGEMATRLPTTQSVTTNGATQPGRHSEPCP